MLRKTELNKIDKIIRAEDGLGLCRFCRFCDKTNLPKTIGLGTDTYYKAHCDKMLTPCHIVRRSLITCSYFKSPLEHNHPPFFIRLLTAMCEMDGTLIRESHPRWN